MVTGIDLVRAQLRIARGERLWITQEQVTWHGHAIECRINAEDPAAGFRPALGTLSEYIEPTGYGVRVDSGARAGYTIPQYYDSLIAKLITWGADRDEALARMRRALADFQIDGVATTIAFHQLALAHPAFASGAATVNFIPRYLAEQLQALAATTKAPSSRNGELTISESIRTFTVEVNGRRFDVRVAEDSADSLQNPANGKPRAPRRSAAGTHRPAADGVVSPIQGAILAVRAKPGQVVEAGQVLFIIEAMKMENEVTAPHAGTLAEVRAALGQVIEAGMVLATYVT
jgi:acetyl-CoA/propionyl-CoA carboxylase biotin carboxyl carrier protein